MLTKSHHVREGELRNKVGNLYFSLFHHICNLTHQPVLFDSTYFPEGMGVSFIKILIHIQLVFNNESILIPLHLIKKSVEGKYKVK